MTKDNVLLVAVGGIGFRHFQALLNCESEFELHVVDISEDAVNRAKSYGEEQNSGKQVHYYGSVSALAPQLNIQIAIIATSSLARRTVFEELVSRCNVKTVIFEKVLFPRLKDYEEVGSLLKENNIAAYVNCVRRVQNVYQELRKEIRCSERLCAQIKGGDWGLACNAIHMVDLFAYLSPIEFEYITCNGSLLENQIYNSKRNGYIEFYGKLTGKIGDRTTYLLECSHGKASILIELFTDSAYYCIDESNGLMTIQSLDSGKFTEKHFLTSYVSQTTTKIVDTILKTGTSELTGYAESVKFHKPILREILHKKNEILGRDDKVCPIT